MLVIATLRSTLAVVLWVISLWGVVLQRLEARLPGLQLALVFFVVVVVGYNCRILEALFLVLVGLRLGKQVLNVELVWLGEPCGLGDLPTEILVKKQVDFFLSGHLLTQLLSWDLLAIGFVRRSDSTTTCSSCCSSCCWHYIVFIFMVVLTFPNIDINMGSLIFIQSTSCSWNTWYFFFGL